MGADGLTLYCVNGILTDKPKFVKNNEENRVTESSVYSNGARSRNCILPEHAVISILFLISLLFFEFLKPHLSTV